VYKKATAMPRSAALSWQNKQVHCCVQESNCHALEIAASLSKSTSLTFPLPVHIIYCSLFFLQRKFGITPHLSKIDQYNFHSQLL